MSPLQVEEIAVRSVLTPQDDESVLARYDFSLNPYQGCGMGCSYCYVIRYPFTDLRPGRWGDWVRPKVNAPFLLGRARAKIWGKRVFMSSATDPYQYVERRYRLTRRCLKILLECNLKRLTVHTRSHLVLDDLDLLLRFGDRVEVGFSVPTDDDLERRRLEPKAPRIEVRLATMRRLREAGIRVRAAVAPLLRCHPERFAQRLSEAADSAWVDSLRYEDRTYLRDRREDGIYFRSVRYRKMVAELEERLREVGLRA
jgi:DNA repair photolyase